MIGRVRAQISNLIDIVLDARQFFACRRLLVIVGRKPVHLIEEGNAQIACTSLSDGKIDQRTHRAEGGPAEIAKPDPASQLQRPSQAALRQRAVDQSAHQQGIDGGGKTGQAHTDQAKQIRQRIGPRSQGQEFAAVYVMDRLVKCSEPTARAMDSRFLKSPTS